MASIITWRRVRLILLCVTLTGMVIFSRKSVTAELLQHPGSDLQGYRSTSTQTLQPDPTSPPTLKTIEDAARIAAGPMHTCLVNRTGGVKCWGNNSSGELGDGTEEIRYLPVDVSGLSSGVVTVALGYDFSCAVMQDGKVKCWGNNFNGQLGDGTNEDKLMPTDVVGLGGKVTSLAAGDDFTCALLEDGQVQCWGFNAWGLVGEDTVDQSNTPVEVSDLPRIVEIVAGFDHACGRDEEGAVWCWGRTGLLGVEAYDNGPLQVPGLDNSVTRLAAGYYHTCAVQKNAVKCWGLNNFGQLGDGNPTSSQVTPVSTQEIEGEVLDLAAGMYHTCEVTSTGVFCWGGNVMGQLGDGTATTQLVPVEVMGLSARPISLAAGVFHTCALTSAGTVECWGLQRNGLLGNTLGEENRVEPVQVKGLTEDNTTIAAGESISCAVSRGGGGYCWGFFITFTELMEITEGKITRPGIAYPIGGLQEEISSFAIGGDHICSLSTAGRVYCWGENYQGQLGNGLDEGSDSPVPVVGLDSGVMTIAAGRDHTCAIQSDRVMCWGDNAYGQLGDGGTEEQRTPVAVRGLPGQVTAIAPSNYDTCALTEDGSVYCWGSSVYGLLGDDIQDNSSTPVRIQGIPPGVVSISAGEYFACVLTENGEVYCWGNNSEGQLGDGTFDYRESGIQIVSGLDSDVMAITSGEAHTCALTKTGRVSCWGYNSYGQLGDFSQEMSPLPVRVPRLGGNIQTIAAGKFHTCAMTSAGEVWCWGNNEVGQLGNDTLIHPSPVLVMQIGSVGFRNPAPLVPELTTHIPTPLDISTDPRVIGANLGFAAVAMILLTTAIEMLNKVLEESEETLQRLFKPARWIGMLKQRLESGLSTHLPRTGWIEAIKVIGIVAFYGLIFSFLDPDWRPLSLNGVYLFFCMVLAFGLVGIIDDLLQWRVAKQWGVPASLDIRPANLLLAVASTSFSRLLVIVPGIMFGTPEAFKVDKEALDGKRIKRLLGITLGTLVGIGGGVWLVTAGTAWLQKGRLPELASLLVGGLESLLLVVFAVAIENLFVQMLAMPGSLGRDLMKYNRWAWGAGLLGITFIFYHTLLNPKGELVQALSSRNTRSFFLTIGIFVVGTLVLWSYNTLHKRRKARLPVVHPVPEGMVDEGVAISVLKSPPTEVFPIPHPQALVVKGAQEEHKALILPVVEEKIGPPSEPAKPIVMHMEEDKEPPLTPAQPVAARMEEEIEPPLTPAQPVAARMEEQIESPLTPAQPVVAFMEEEIESPLTPAQPVVAFVEEQIEPPSLLTQKAEAVEDTKKCPMCGETIKLEARLCRYCRTRFEVSVQGYCLNCHDLVTLDERDRCSICGSTVVDRHVKSEWLGNHTTTSTQGRV